MAKSDGNPERVEALVHRGVRVLDPRQVFIDGDVDLARIAASATLFPGARLHGSRTFLGPNSRVGTEGPAVLVDVVLGADTTVASGFANGCVLLRGAGLGANSHVRPGTLLEEEASTAHCVGLKQTILLSFVTLGSLINFCDVLMAGGSSRRDHSEVGSGYIHFNFTPWGKSGDKATPSLVGEVTEGVFLRQKRIFLGGSGGLVGPCQIGYGSIAAAGQVVRRDVKPGRLVLAPPERLDIPLEDPGGRRVARVLERNATFIGHLAALREWYRQVRLARIPAGADSEHSRVVTAAALEVLDDCLDERWKRLSRFLDEHGRQVAAPRLDGFAACPLDVEPGHGPVDHIDWVGSLSPAAVKSGTAWLRGIVDRVQSDLE